MKKKIKPQEVDRTDGWMDGWRIIKKILKNFNVLISW